MIFLSTDKIKISYEIYYPIEDEEFERAYAKEQNKPFQRNSSILELKSIYMKKDFIPDVFYIENMNSYSSADNNYIIRFNNRIQMVFEDLSEVNFWFSVFNSDFEGKTLKELKTEFPEEFL